jgi:hypothetical protein
MDVVLDGWFGVGCGNVGGGLWGGEVVYNWGMAFIRKFETGSGATGVQVVRKSGGRVVETIHVGSANSDVALKKLLRKAEEIMHGGQRKLFDMDEGEGISGGGRD